MAEGPKQKISEAKYKTNRRWIVANPKWVAEYGRRYCLKYPEKYLHRVAKHRAKKRGVEFSITPADIRIPETCPVFGFPLVLGVGISGKPGGNFNSPSLDRIDPSVGYVPGNVRVISHLANSMKRDATPAQLRQFAEWVLGGSDA